MSFIFTNGLQCCVCFFSSHFCCHCSLFNLHSSDCFICLLYVIHVNCVWEYVIDCVSADQLLFSQIRELCKHAILIRLNKHEYFKAHPVVVFHGTLGKITWIRQHTSFRASKENDYAVFFFQMYLFMSPLFQLTGDISSFVSVDGTSLRSHDNSFAIFGQFFFFIFFFNHSSISSDGFLGLEVWLLSN